MKISFAQWFVIGFPVATILLVANYFAVTRILFPNKLAKIEGSDQLLQNRLNPDYALEK
jgi:sodium-dependent dicarboxylate transporter 2/3/5